MKAAPAAASEPTAAGAAFSLRRAPPRVSLNVPLHVPSDNIVIGSMRRCPENYPAVTRAPSAGVVAKETFIAYNDDEGILHNYYVKISYIFS